MMNAGQVNLACGRAGQYTLRHHDLTHRRDDGHQGAVAVQPRLLADAELDEPLQGGAGHEAGHE